jgi:hypothetical protein
MEKNEFFFKKKLIILKKGFIDSRIRIIKAWSENYKGRLRLYSVKSIKISD